LLFQGYHVQVTARSESDLSPEAIIQKVADASGAKYSAASTPAPKTAPQAGPKPPVATKPVFPTRVTGANLPIGSRAPFRRSENEDADGWGADAPQVTRTQLEKVAPAYKPTKVDINELRSQPTSTTSGYSKSEEDRDDVVKGGYQPIGKVDIAALRKGYKEERPEPVKGSYTPVDVNAIRKVTPSRPEPEPIPVASVSERAGAFSQPSQAERQALARSHWLLVALAQPAQHRFRCRSASTSLASPNPQPRSGLKRRPGNAVCRVLVLPRPSPQRLRDSSR
jgi:hypothetical protein